MNINKSFWFLGGIAAAIVLVLGVGTVAAYSGKMSGKNESSKAQLEKSLSCGCTKNSSTGGCGLSGCSGKTEGNRCQNKVCGGNCGNSLKN